MKRKEAVGITAAAIIGAAFIGLASVNYAAIFNAIPEPGSIVLEPCVTEDSVDCYWNGTTMGNGDGTSFIHLNGITYRPEGE